MLWTLITLCCLVICVEGSSRFLIAKSLSRHARKISSSSKDAFTELPAFLESMDPALSNHKEVATQILSITRPDPLLHELICMIPHVPQSNLLLPMELIGEFWQGSSVGEAFEVKFDEQGKRFLVVKGGIGEIRTHGTVKRFGFHAHSSTRPFDHFEPPELVLEFTRSEQVMSSYSKFKSMLEVLAHRPQSASKSSLKQPFYILMKQIEGLQKESCAMNDGNYRNYGLVYDPFQRQRYLTLSDYYKVTGMSSSEINAFIDLMLTTKNPNA